MASKSKSKERATGQIQTDRGKGKIFFFLLKTFLDISYRIEIFFILHFSIHFCCVNSDEGILAIYQLSLELNRITVSWGKMVKHFNQSYFFPTKVIYKKR